MTMHGFCFPCFIFSTSLSVYLPTGSFRKASPQTPNINENEKRIKRLEKLKRDLQNIKNERDILQGILAKYKDLNDR